MPEACAFLRPDGSTAPPNVPVAASANGEGELFAALYSRLFVEETDEAGDTGRSRPQRDAALAPLLAPTSFCCSFGFGEKPRPPLSHAAVEEEAGVDDEGYARRAEPENEPEDADLPKRSLGGQGGTRDATDRLGPAKETSEADDRMMLTYKLHDALFGTTIPTAQQALETSALHARAKPPLASLGLI